MGGRNVERQVDARGMNCPKPVIETKKVLDALKEGSITTIVDNEIAKENVLKLVQNMAYKADVKEQGGNYYIHIYKEGSHKETGMKPINHKDMVMLIGSEVMGEGSFELGKVLMKGFIYTLTESKPYPKALLFVNSGVRLTTEGSEVIDYLRQMEGEGVEILSCGTCLDYFNLKNKLLVGGVSNMYTIVEKMNGAKNTIKI
ncbi:sulfurtransferase-like selenium metabolism protein YedF [Anaerosolibacter carboniphilus]|uniref:sulfurtransferase-like selenium metabolism protein YedF n=1 Tax=Anaerosolibacter carboniphilus TaxID=1417629 RepID=UPI001A9BD803|nr:sulfurtransferase-like selenium metabolism protein YedF [Anaerosolibacter carboniphilus]